MSVSHMKGERKLKTLPTQCQRCRSYFEDCGCPTSWYPENIIPNEQRLHVRFPKNATMGSRFNECLLPIEVMLLIAQFMNSITLLTLMQVLYPWIIPSTILSHLRYNAPSTYRMIHDFLLCLETGYTINDYWTDDKYGPIPTCFAFTCSPMCIPYSHRHKYTCGCGFSYSTGKEHSIRDGMLYTSLRFKYMENIAFDDLHEFTHTFDFWTGPRMGPYTHMYVDAAYEESEYEEELAAKHDTRLIIKSRVKVDNKSHDQKKKLMRAHKNARASRVKRYAVKGRNIPNKYRDMSLV